MRISFPQSYSYVNFKAKNEKTRKADDVLRKTRQVFPMVSSTYIDDFYAISHSASKKRNFVKKISDKIHKEILERRKTVEIAREKITQDEDLLYAYELSQIKEQKTGNCMENAKAALAVLFANGFYNSERVNLYLDINLVNKNTGQTEYSKQEFLNHSVVLTDMNRKGKKDIVIDPWADFAGNIQEASGKYKQLYDGDLDIYETMHKKIFFIEKLSQGEEINLDDYEANLKFSYHPFCEFDYQEDKEKLACYIKTDYPEVILNKKKN